MAKKKKRNRARDDSQHKEDRKGAFYRPFEGIGVRVKAKGAVSPQRSAPRVRKEAPPEPSPSSPEQGRSGGGMDDEMLTFERLMRGVTPLEHKKGVRVVPTSRSAQEVSSPDRRVREALAKEQRLEAQARAKLQALVSEGERFPWRDDGRRVEGRRRGVSAGVLQALGEGRMAVGATLDLRSMEVDEAREQVVRFLARSRAEGHRAVVLQMGEPRREGRPNGVLRGELAAWLAEGEASRDVDGFCTAPESLGGRGAVCVLVRGTG